MTNDARNFNRAMNMLRTQALALAACASVLSACGGGQQTASVVHPIGSSPSPSPGTSPSPGPTPSPGPSGTPLSVTVDASSAGVTIHELIRGVNFGAWHNITQPGMSTILQSMGMRLVRWPGGSLSDQYHWQTNTWCGNDFINPNSTFDHFMQDVAVPAGVTTAVTVNYGSNSACNAGGDPAEAAAWVNYANNVQHYGIHWWTVGNEEYGQWEYDLHAVRNDAATYSDAVLNNYYPQMKAMDPSINVGIDVDSGYNRPGWDTYVLAHARFDFVEYHWYAQGPNHEDDNFLLNQAPGVLGQRLQILRNEMNAAGVPASTPIYLGEYSSQWGTPGKQTISIVGGLFTGEVIAQLLQAGIQLSTVWEAFGGCGNGNNSPSLYGWQTFGTNTIFSDGLPENGCGQAVPFATPFPPARAYQLISHFALANNQMLGTTLSGSATNVLAYAATQGSGYAYLFFNLNQTSAATATIGLTHAARKTFSATSYVYDKALYDQSQNGVWAPPTTTSLGTVGTTFNATLTPWSMTVIVLQ